MAADYEALNVGALEQPFSLVTISSGRRTTKMPRDQDASNNDNLLTIKCLESSEKKMRLLRDLLEPDEFRRSVAQARREQANNKSQEQFVSIPANLNELARVEGPQREHPRNSCDQGRRATRRARRTKRLTYSANQLRPHRNSKESQLLMKQKADEFFHGQVAAHAKLLSTSNQVASELKASQSYQSASDKQHLDSIMSIHFNEFDQDQARPWQRERDTTGSLLAWLSNLILAFVCSCFQVCLSLGQTVSLDQSSDGSSQFIRYYQSIGADSKQASSRNLSLIWRRFKAASQDSKALEFCVKSQLCSQWILVRVRSRNRRLDSRRATRTKKGETNEATGFGMQAMMSSQPSLIKFDGKLPLNLVPESNVITDFVSRAYTWLYEDIVSLKSYLIALSCLDGSETNHEEQRATAGVESSISAPGIGAHNDQLALSEDAAKVENLYEKLFKVAGVRGAELLTIQEKRARLLNRIDPNCLLELLFNRKREVEFKLDPIESSRGGFSLSLRQKLLLWRSSNNLIQLTIHLNELENLRLFGMESSTTTTTTKKDELEEQQASYKQLDEVHHYLALKPIAFSDHRLIGQMRLRAANTIRQYELKLLELIEFESRKLRPKSRPRANELLCEPQLNWAGFKHVDWLSMLRKVLQPLSMPRRQARRPLMAQRQQRAPFNSHRRRLKNNMSLIVHNTNDLESSRTIPLATKSNDHTNVVDATSLLAGSQLVITIQQALNVPIRINMHQNQMLQKQLINYSDQSQRVASPFLGIPQQALATSPGARSPTGLASLNPGELPASQPSLVAPTSYVELIFQRRHQATSLVMGKEPAWNETFFFPIVEHSSRQKYQANSSAQVLDEFLQFNLYDYDSYFINDNHNNNNHSSSSDSNEQVLYNADEMSLDAQLSLKNELNIMNHGLKSVSATHKRIERHLLGTLRIPLSTIMNNDKIEGAFALNQPIFLDNYQFESNSSDTKLRIFISLDNPTHQRHPSASSASDCKLSSFLHLPYHDQSHETQQVYEFARIWEQTLSGKSPITNEDNFSRSAPRFNLLQPKNRYMRALVLYKDFKYILLNRFLAPLSPPSGLIRDKQTMRFELARFVSLLNPIKDGMFSVRLLDSRVCFDSRQLLEQNLGGKDERAILLCNYFLYSGLCCGLIQGNAIPDGACTYVIIWINQNDNHDYEEGQEEREREQLLNLGLDPNSRSSLLQLQQEKQEGDAIQNNADAAAVEAEADPAALPSRNIVNHLNFITNLPILISAKNIQVWDPQSAKCYNLMNDSDLPLLNISSIVTPDNIYANIQARDSILDTNFDIRIRANWFPLFDQNATMNGKQAILSSQSTSNAEKARLDRSSTRIFRSQSQRARQLSYLGSLAKTLGKPSFNPIISPSYKPNYNTFSDEHCAQLRSFLEKAIKTQLLTWRHNRPTYFNRTLSRKLASRLAQMEDFLRYSSRLQTSSTNTNDWRNELADLIRNSTLGPYVNKHGASGGINTRKIVSWPINISYTSLKPILDSLYASDIHNADLVLDATSSHLSGSDNNLDNNNDNSAASSYHTQFLVSSYVHVYPAHIMSVWLYVAALVPVHPGQQRSFNS